LVLHQTSRDHADWRLPELNGELSLIAGMSGASWGFSEDDAGFDPSIMPARLWSHHAQAKAWNGSGSTSCRSIIMIFLPPIQRPLYLGKMVRTRQPELGTETLAQLQASNE